MYTSSLDREVLVFDISLSLQAPFSVHPKTQTISVPFIASQIDTFRPDQVPTLAEVMDNHALLDPYIDIFKAFVAPLTNKRKIQQTRSSW